MTNDDIARVAHEVNKAYCEFNGDYSQLSWEDAPEWQRNSCADGVKFHRENPGSPPSASHDNWMREKEREGWKWGPEKNADKREHPCMVPFEELPEEQQVKDVLFSAVVRALG